MADLETKVLRGDATSTGSSRLRSPSEFIQAKTISIIRHHLSMPDLPVYRDLKGMCERVSDSYRDRVISELLQNAHDAHPAEEVSGRIKVILDPEDGPYGTLIVANDGHGFSNDDFDAICSPSITTKNVNEAIGNKGIGFLSVFQVCAHPEIYSRFNRASDDFDGFCFVFGHRAALHRLLAAEKLTDHEDKIVTDMPRIYLACPIIGQPPLVASLAREGYASAVRLPLKNEEALKSVRQQVHQLSDEAPPMQLFLTRIAELETISDAGRKVLTRHSQTLAVMGHVRLSKIECGDSSFVVVQRTIAYDEIMPVIKRDVAAENLSGNWLKWKGDAVISLAVPTEGPPLKGRIYNFLPMGPEAHAPLSAHLDAPFHATIDRRKLQPGVELNALFLTLSRELALAGAREAKRVLPADEARRVVLDLLIWRGNNGSEQRETILNTDERLIPTLHGEVGMSWATLREARLWPQTGFVDATRASYSSPFPIVDPEIGLERVEALHRWTASTPDLLKASADERAAIFEGVAQQLGAYGAPITDWDKFYDAIAAAFSADPSPLLGRKVLLTEGGEVVGTDPRTEQRRTRRTRSSTIFLPPLRAAGCRIAVDHAELPSAAKRRLAYLDPRLAACADSTNKTRGFLVTAQLVREYVTREVVRLLAGVIAQPDDPDGVRWDVFRALKRIVIAEDMSDSAVTEIDPRVPTSKGWARASEAYFGAGWFGTKGDDLEGLFKAAAGISADLDQLTSRVLRPFGHEWSASRNERDRWITFLRKAGVVDRLRAVSALAGPSPRVSGAELFSKLIAQVRLPPVQEDAWRKQLGNSYDLPNPYTLWTANSVQLLPGQRDFEALRPVAGWEYAEQVVRALEAQPELMEMTVYRPSEHPRYNDHKRQKPSPVAAFVEGAAWVPLANGGFARLGDAWLPGEHTPPPGLLVVEARLCSLIHKCEHGAEVLRRAGLSEYGASRSAWHLLEVLGNLVTPDASNSDLERIYGAAQEAFKSVPQNSSVPNPLALKLIGRQRGLITSTAPATSDLPILLADGDDYEIVAAKAESDPETVVVELPPSCANDIAAVLFRQFPDRITRASLLRASYESDGQQISFDPADPFIEDELGNVLREIVTLVLRYRCRFWRGNIEDALQRLSLVRLRWLPDLSMRFGEQLFRVARFTDHGVLFPSPHGPTILAPLALKESSKLLIGLAEALGEAVGSRRMVGEPLIAFVAQLGDNPLNSDCPNFARVLGIPEKNVRGVLGAARASVGGLLRTLRPFVYLWSGGEAGRRFVTETGLATLDDVVKALEARSADLPLDASTIVRRCRDAGSIAAVAKMLRVDLAALNMVLADLGESPIDLTSDHQSTLQSFLNRSEPRVQEGIRNAYRARFEAGEELSAYVAARDARRPQLPEGMGRELIELRQELMEQWLAAWLKGHGAELATHLPRPQNSRASVFEANLKRLRSMVPDARIAVLTKTTESDPLRGRWATRESAERALVDDASSKGWADFDRLDEAAALTWLKRDGFWPTNWPLTLNRTALGISDAEVNALRQRDEWTRAEATKNPPQQIPYSGGVFTVGVDTFSELAGKVSELVTNNKPLLETPTRLSGGMPVKLREAPAHHSRDTVKRDRKQTYEDHISEDERDVIGFVGERIAFDWLKHRFGGKRVVDATCWVSAYRGRLYPEQGDDTLGYDFKILNGKTCWCFEVKATKRIEPSPRQYIELGSSELAQAEKCKADKRFRYRILYVMNALQPEKSEIFSLPNPRSKAGLDFFTGSQSAGLRLWFGLARNDSR